MPVNDVEEMSLEAIQFQTVPPIVELSVDRRGAELVFPQGKRLTFVEEVQIVMYSIYRRRDEGQASDYVIYERQNDGTFLQTEGRERYSLSWRDPITRVTCELYNAQEVLLGGQSKEVTPTELGAEGGFLLYWVERRSPGGKLYQKDRVHPGVNLRSRELYLVVPFRQRIDSIMLVSEGGNRETHNLEREEYLFSPYQDMTDQQAIRQVIIAGIEYNVVPGIGDYLMSGMRMPHISVYREPRYLVCCGEERVFNQRCQNEGIRAYFREYRQNGYGTELDVTKGVPRALYWKRGALRLRFRNNTWLNQLIVFVENVPETVDRNQMQVCIDGENQEVPLPQPGRPARIRVDKERNRFSVELEVTNNRRVFFGVTDQSQEIQVCAGGDYLNPVTQISSRDFNFLRGRILGRGRQTAFITRGMKAIKVLPNQVFSGAGIQNDDADFRAEADTHYAIGFCDADKEIQPDAIFPFEVYEQTREPVEHTREGNDLILTYRCAVVDCKKPKELRFYSTHHKEKVLEASLPAERVSEACQPDARTHCYRETLRVPNFYGPDRNLDWGLGLLCFIVAKESKAVGHVVSSDFWVSAPEALAAAPADDPSGIRSAFAGDVAAWAHVVLSQEGQVQADVRDFLQRLQEAMLRWNVLRYRYSHWALLTQTPGMSFPSCEEIQRLPAALLKRLDCLLKLCREEMREFPGMPKYLSLQKRFFDNPGNLIYSAMEFGGQTPGICPNKHFRLAGELIGAPTTLEPEELMATWELLGKTLRHWQAVQTAEAVQQLDRALALFAEMNEAFIEQSNGGQANRVTDAVFFFARPQ